MRHHKIRILLGLVLIFNISFAALCGKAESKTRTLAKATDDFAEGQKSIANLLANAKSTGLISQEDVNEIKPFLLQANDLNEKAIGYGKKLLTTPEDPVMQERLIETINQISSVLVRANNAGLFRIKDSNTKLAFSALIAALQNIATSAIIIIKN